MALHPLAHRILLVIGALGAQSFGCTGPHCGADHDEPTGCSGTITLDGDHSLAQTCATLIVGQTTCPAADDPATAEQLGVSSDDLICGSPPTHALPQPTSTIATIASSSTGPADPTLHCCYTIIVAQPPQCVGGRPFVVDGAAVVASRVARGDWAVGGACGEQEAPLGAEDRALLADAWAADAALEHASIASFARLSLDLLALGAPSDLVDGAAKAMRDEVGHARLSYGISSRFASEPRGPGPLQVGHSERAISLAELARATVEEGCIGETLAALVATEALAVARDEDTRRALRVIARDEAEHAELAYRIVAWALREGGEDVRVAVEDAFRSRPRGQHDALAADDLAENATHARYGRLSARQLAAVSRAAFQNVIEPCGAALLSNVCEA